jgi:hypothetical protein
MNELTAPLNQMIPTNNILDNINWIPNTNIPYIQYYPVYNQVYYPTICSDTYHVFPC